MEKSSLGRSSGLLATQPQIGWHPRLKKAALASLRVFRVWSFEKILGGDSLMSAGLGENTTGKGTWSSYANTVTPEPSDCRTRHWASSEGRGSSSDSFSLKARKFNQSSNRGLCKCSKNLGRVF